MRPTVTSWRRLLETAREEYESAGTPLHEGALHEDALRAAEELPVAAG